MGELLRFLEIFEIYVQLIVSINVVLRGASPASI